VVHLAQVNAATLRFPVDDPRLTGFLAAIGRINRLADITPGFVWRDPDAHQHLHRPDDGGPAVTVVNLSVWETYGALHAFTYRGLHGQLVRRRAEWFLPSGGATTALWWIREGERPTATAALARLAHLRRHGPTPRAFTTRRRFDADGRPEPRRRPHR
jgi:hypothetical protein